jgi:hypothetical protein
MCEAIIFFMAAAIAALLLWVVILDGRLDDIRRGVRDE